ncbi:hypothetical protein D7X94_03345 [Acutalibacter sp. 1XD8-33]|uniref:hypothetical protein n=1 Tax=Acutalibacter sp. 1XD8-33 TaxID=2320081 RepID=UPI000EA225BA|nr:hypothetical protein [Acutalibacter sp. 1XD8-33]RKJ41337.1 hypothetical protein D7X94_03345 [Acutalibacter sp. 1XD8-33]
MTSERMENFCWFDFSRAEGHTSEENYQELVDWSREARGKNPNAFDSLKDWVLDDPSWSGGNLVGSWGQLANGLIGRFREQNAGFRRILQEMELPELVNPAVFPALDAFDRTLEGELPDPQLKEAVRQMLASPAAMESHSLRARIAGGKTGSYGTDAIEVTGYLNFLEDADAAVQWTLFMPGVVEDPAGETELPYPSRHPFSGAGGGGFGESPGPQGAFRGVGPAGSVPLRLRL